MDAFHGLGARTGYVLCLIPYSVLFGDGVLVKPVIYRYKLV